MELTEHLVCKECKKPFSCTAKWRNYAGHWCQSCRAAYMRPRIAAYKKSAKGRAYDARFRRERPELLQAQGIRARTKRRDLYQGFKAVPCTDCGVTYPHYVMQFDHVKPGKIGCVATIKGGCKDRLLKEIAKCEVVCANCHAERTYKRAQEKKNAGTRVQVARCPDGGLRPLSAL